ncbi:MAG: T9SS type A sorting domain-containing protein [Flavobacteriales bacterium]
MLNVLLDPRRVLLCLCFALGVLHAQLPSVFPTMASTSPAVLGGSPANGQCAGASVVTLPMNTPVTVTGNNQNAPTDPVFVANVVWEGFTTTACSDLTVSYCGTTPNFQGGLVYLATGCPLTNLVFNSAANIIPNICGDANFGLRFPGLPAGTYYYPVLEAPGSSGDYTLVFTAEPCTVTPPANAFCAGAIPLDEASTCEPVSGTVENATAANITGSACGNGNVSDGVWYSFVASSPSNEITVDPSDEFNVHLSLITGDCDAQTLLACAIGQNFGTTTTLSATGLVVGDTYYIRVADWYAGVPRTSTFDICVVAVATAECEAAAGNVIPDQANVCYAGPGTTITATPSGTSIIPEGFNKKFLLVSSTEVVLQVSDLPSFSSLSVGSFSIRTLIYDPLTYDPSTITLGSSTIGSLNELFIQGGGPICASLDITGAGFTVENCCTANAGTLSAAEPTVCFEEGGVTIAALVNADPLVPAGSVVEYLLVADAEGTVVDTAASPTFQVDGLGTYTIHALVYDTLTYSLDSITLDTTTIIGIGGDFVAGGGALCGAIDFQGTAISVVRCCPGTLGEVVVANDSLCFVPEGAIFTWDVQDADVPEGYTVSHLIASETGAVLDTTSFPIIRIDAVGAYTLHQLVHDTATFDLASAIGEAVTIDALNALFVQGGGAICALLDTVGASVQVLDCSPANDDCSSPEYVTVQVIENCNAGLVEGDNTYATAGDVAAPSCIEPDAGIADVWYAFNSGANTGITINFDPGTMTAWGIAVQDACDGTELLCVLQPSAPVDLDVAPGTPLLIRIFTDLTQGGPGAFAMCVTGAVTSTICNGGAVSTANGDSLVSICQDGDADVVDLSTTSQAPVSYTYVVTDVNDVIVAVVAGNALDFNGLMLGTYRVHGVSHDGALTGTAVGSPLEGISSTGQCNDFAANTVEVRVEICSRVLERTGGTWSLWPNPTTGHFTVTGATLSAGALVEVFGPDGRRCFGERLEASAFGSMEAHLPADRARGLYLVRLVNPDGSGSTARLIVE